MPRMPAPRAEWLVRSRSTPGWSTMTIGSRSLPRKCWATFTSTADCTEAVSASRYDAARLLAGGAARGQHLEDLGLRHARERVGLEQVDRQEGHILQPLDLEAVRAAEHPVQHVAVGRAPLGVMPGERPHHGQQPLPLLAPGASPYGGRSSRARAGLVTGRLGGLVILLARGGERQLRHPAERDGGGRHGEEAREMGDQRVVRHGFVGRHARAGAAHPPRSRSRGPGMPIRPRAPRPPGSRGGRTAWRSA